MGGEWVGRGKGVLHGEIAQGEGAILGMNLGRPIVTNGTLWRSYSLP